MELSELFKKVSGAAVATIVTGFFSFFNLGLLFYYSWKLALCTTILLAVLFFVTLLLLGGLLRYESSIRAIDGAYRDFSSSSLAESALFEPRGPRAAPSRAGQGATPTGSPWRSGPDDFRAGIHRWLSVYPVLTAMGVYVGALYIDPGLMDTGSFIAFNIDFAALMAAVLEVGYTPQSVYSSLSPRYERLRPDSR